MMVLYENSITTLNKFIIIVVVVVVVVIIN
jgi:hypothetical protein